MSPKKDARPTSSREAKRARFEQRQVASARGPSPLVLIAGLAIVLVLIGGAAYAVIRSSGEPAVAQAGAAEPQTESNSPGSESLAAVAATHGHEPYPLAVAENGEVRFALATFDDEKAHHYTYLHLGRPIEFFVLKSKDGVVRAAFNACDVCFLSKKGYTQDGDEVVCNNCGRRFPADQINVVHGGCNPSPLSRTVDGDSLVIRVEDIIQGLDYF